MLAGLLLVGHNRAAVGDGEDAGGGNDGYRCHPDEEEARTGPCPDPSVRDQLLRHIIGERAVERLPVDAEQTPELVPVGGSHL